MQRLTEQIPVIMFKWFIGGIQKTEFSSIISLASGERVSYSDNKVENLAELSEVLLVLMRNI